MSSSCRGSSLEPKNGSDTSKSTEEQQSNSGDAEGSADRIPNSYNDRYLAKNIKDVGLQTPRRSTKLPPERVDRANGSPPGPLSCEASDGGRTERALNKFREFEQHFPPSEDTSDASFQEIYDSSRDGQYGTDHYPGDYVLQSGPPKCIKDNQGSIEKPLNSDTNEFQQDSDKKEDSSGNKQKKK